MARRPPASEGWFMTLMQLILQEVPDRNGTLYAWFARNYVPFGKQSFNPRQMLHFMRLLE